MKTATHGFLVLLFIAVFGGSSFAAHQITAWPENKKGAVSLNFDDGYNSQYSLGVPALDARGLKGSFYPIIDGIGGWVAGWNSWRTAANNGHEIGSHTITHPDLTSLSPAQVQEELAGSKAEIDAQITSQKCRTLVYPYGDFNSNVISVTRNYYIAARGVWCDLNSEPFDIYNVRACTPEDVSIDVYAMTDSTEQQGKWLVVYFHDLASGSYDIDMFTTYLDYLKRKNLWVGTFGAAVKYIQERAAATLSVLSTSSSQMVLNLTDTLNDAIYDQALTLRSEVPSGWTTVNVQQGSSSTVVQSIVEGTTRVIYYNAVPDRGLITLRDPQAWNPQITALAPQYVTAGAPAFPLTVYGTNFLSGARVRWNGSDRATTFVSATQLRANILAADVTASGTVPVTVLNLDAGLSNAVTFEVRVLPPTVADISPSVASAGAPAFPLTVYGTNFLSGAKVRWNGSDRATTFVSATQLQASITAADVTAAGTVPVTVLNPDGGASNAMNFTVWGPAPVVTGLSPSYATAGGSAFTLTVTGSNFVNGAKVRWNGSDRTTTFVSATQLRANILAADVTTAGTVPVTVLNPDGGASNAMNFTVWGPAPVVTGLSPSSATAGGSAFTLTVTGSNFVNGAKVRWNGSDRATTFVSATQLQASITAADVSAAGTVPVTVLNPDGGVSNTVNFTVSAPPSVASLSPSSATAGGSAFTLTVTGSNFVNGAKVRWNGSDRATTFVSATQLQASITAADVSAPGTVPVTVLNPDGGVSNTVNFTVSAPPSVASLSPSSATAGGSAFTLTVTGSNFVNGAKVRWNGADRATTFVSATQLQASITAADVSAPGTVPVTVLNPDGGGSNTISFEVMGPLSPAVTGLSPSYAIAGGSAFTLAVTGSNFVNGAKVRWNGADRTTTFVSATQLQASITAADIAVAGMISISVINPDEGPSGAVNFEVRAAPTVTCTPDLASPQAPGASVLWTAVASGGSGSYQYQFWLHNGTSWSIAKPYGATNDNTWNWDTGNPLLPAGTYSLQVWARSAGSTASYEAYTPVATYVLGTAISPATSVTLTPPPSPASPQAPGASVLWTAVASGGSGSYQYQFWLHNGTSWSIAKPYGATNDNTWNWDTGNPLLPAGTYSLQVWARSAGSTASYEAYTPVATYVLGTAISPATSVTLTPPPSPASPQAPGASVLWTAVASGGSGSYQYQFWLHNGTSWSIAKPYGATNDNTWNWDTIDLDTGTYSLQVWARSAGSTASYEAYTPMATYVLGTAISPATSVTLTPPPSPASPQAPGASVLWTAVASGGSGSYQYQFWLHNGTSWSIAKPYGATNDNTWNWDTIDLDTGTYSVQVWARSAGSTASYEAYTPVATYVLGTAISPATSVTLTPPPSPASPQAPGASVLWTAVASGGSGSYQYQFWLHNGTSWSLAKPYGATNDNTWNWDTIDLDTGTYSVQVWARSAGSTASYEAYTPVATYVLQ